MAAMVQIVQIRSRRLMKADAFASAFFCVALDSP